MLFVTLFTFWRCRKCLRFLFPSPAALRALHSFPTRRSSDLSSLDPHLALGVERGARLGAGADHLLVARSDRLVTVGSQHLAGEDRKSTRRNSSHVRISYAVFCLKKKE